MAVQTIYLLGTTAVTPNWFGNTQLNGSAPTAANSAFGWAPAKNAPPAFWRGRLGATTTSGDTVVTTSYNAGTTGPTKGTGSGATTAGDSFIAGPFTGTFAATAWTLNFNIRAGTAGAVGHVNVRFWRSVNADGSSATQITANTVGATVTLSTSADVNSTISWSPGVLNLNREYLFFQVEWQETTTGGSNSDNVFFRIGTSSFTTADFTATNGQGASAGVGAATGTSLKDVSYPGSAAGVGAAPGRGSSDIRSVGASNGISTISSVGLGTTDRFSSGATSGVGVAAGVGSSTTTTGLTPVIHSIGIGGTHDFTSLAAWAAALPADLVADGHPQIAQLYFNGTGDGEFLNSTSSTYLLYLTGHTTDPTHDITVTTGPGQSFRDNANAQTNPLTYDATKGVGLRVNTGYTGLISIGDRYTTLANLQIYMDGGNSDCIGDTNKIDLQINDCLIVHRSFYNPSNVVRIFNSLQSTLNMRNCCVVANPQNAGTYSYFAIFSFNYINLYNCTIVVPSDSPGAGANTYATFIQYGQISNIASNCAIFGFANLCRTDVNLFTSVITSATDQASPPTGFTGSLTYASQFVDTTLTGGYDFRPSPTGFLPGHGTADTTNAVTDIVGTTRPQGTGWDIGCWEYKVPVTIHSVGIGGTHDYTSLAAWAAALPADLVADGHRQEVQLYFNGSGDGEFVATYNTRILYLVGHNTDIAHNITVTTGPGQSFRDNAGVQTNPLTYDATKGVALACHSLLYTGIIQVEDINVTLSNLQIYMDNGNVHAVYVPTSTPGVQLIINDCLIIAKGTASNVTAIQVYDSGAYLTVTNSCVVLDPLTATGNQAAIYTGFGADLYSCTIVLPQGGASGGVNTYGTWSQYGSGGTAGIIKNCAVFGFSNLYNPSVPFTNITTCATDLASPPTGFTGSLVYADQFIDNNVTGGYDFRPKSTGFLPDHGTIDTINALYDIVGTARPQGTTTDIGCWEVAVTIPADTGVGAAAGHGLAAAVSPPPDHGVGSASGVGIAAGVSPVVLVPVVHWKLSDGSGADLIGSGNTGIFHGSATPTTVGPMGNAVILDGVTGYVINNQVINIPYASLSVWIKTTATTSSSFIGGFANSLGSGVTDKILSINALFAPVWYIYNGGTSTVTGTVAINDGNWHHVVGTYDGVNQNLYLDGVLNNTIVTAGASYTGYNLPNVLLGGYSGGAPNWLPGTFDDFQVFDRALTATEVSSLFAQGVIPGAGSVGGSSGIGLAAAVGFAASPFGVGASAGVGTATGVSPYLVPRPGLVAHAEAYGASGNTTPGIDTTGANLLYIHIGTTATVTPSFTDSYGNTWLLQDAIGDTPTASASYVYYVNSNTPIVGPGHTINWTFSAPAALQFAAFKSSTTWTYNGANDHAGNLPFSTGAVASTNSLVITSAICGTSPYDLSSSLLPPQWTTIDIQPLRAGVNYSTGVAYTTHPTSTFTDSTWNSTGALFAASGAAQVLAFTGAWTDTGFGLAAGTGTATAYSELRPLDIVGGASVAYSINRLLAIAHHQVILTIRRASDNTFQQFPYFAGDIVVSDINTWLGGSAGYVEYLYDHTPNNVGMSQNTNALQPQWIDNVIGGRPGVQFTKTPLVHLDAASGFTVNNAANFTIFAVALSTSPAGAGGGYVLSAGTSAAGYLYGVNISRYSSPNNQLNITSTAAAPTGGTIPIWGSQGYGTRLASFGPPIVFDTQLAANGSPQLDSYINGVNFKFGAGFGNTNPGTISIANQPVSLGTGSSGIGTDTTLCELIVYPFALNPTDRAAIRQNLFDYYSITPFVGFGAGLAQGQGLAAAQSTTGAGVDTYAVGSSSGIGVATATGISDARTIGAASGTGTATAVGSYTLPASASPGTATGLGTALAGGSSDARSAIASAGLGIATAQDKSDALTVGSVFGTSTAIAHGSSDVRSIGNASGLGSANGTDKEDSSGVGNAAGTSSATGVIFAELKLIGTASGFGSVSGQGKSDVRSVGLCTTNSGIATGVGYTDFVAIGTASGIGSATAVSLGGIGLAGYAPGVATVTGVIKADVYGSGSAAGVGSGTSVIFDDTIGTGNAHGQGNAVALADTGAATGNAHGQGTATSVGKDDFIAFANTSGLGSATASASSDARCTGTAAGVGSATATSYFTTERFAAGNAAGTGTAVSTGRTDYTGAGSSAGVGIATATSIITLNYLIVGTAAGHSTVNGVGVSDARSVGNTSGVGSAIAIAGATSLSTTGEADGVGTATAVGNAGFSAVGIASGTSIVTAISFMSYGVIGHSTGFGLASARSTSDDETIGNASGIGLAVGRGSGSVIDWMPAAPGTIPIAPPDRNMITDELNRIVKASKGRRIVSDTKYDRVLNSTNSSRTIVVRKTPRRVL